MLQPSKKTLLFLALAVFASACGGSAAENGPGAFQASLTNATMEAVWHTENGDALLTPTSGALITAENGLQYSDAVFVEPVDGLSQYVNGVILADLPDQDQIRFSVKIGFPQGLEGDVVFRLYLQNGTGMENSFPLLAEVRAQADGSLDVLEADLSEYGPDTRLLILSATTEGQPLSTPFLLIEPRLLSSS